MKGIPEESKNLHRLPKFDRHWTARGGFLENLTKYLLCEQNLKQTLLEKPKKIILCHNLDVPLENNFLLGIIWSFPAVVRLPRNCLSLFLNETDLAETGQCGRSTQHKHLLSSLKWKARQKTEFRAWAKRTTPSFALKGDRLISVVSPILLKLVRARTLRGNCGGGGKKRELSAVLISRGRKLVLWAFPAIFCTVAETGTKLYSRRR